MGKIIWIFLLLIVMAACQEQSPSYRELEAKLLVRLVGLWQVEGQATFESWIADEDTIFHGMVFEQSGDDKIVKEVLKIVWDGDESFYEALVEGQNDGKPVRFKLVGLTGKKMTFFNARHDFPKKIEYEFLDDNHILATVSDGKGDTGKSFTIKYLRVMKQKKVTGIGGIFFKSRDPEKMRNWYQENLGLVTNEYGSLFEFRESDNPEKKAYLQWSLFSADTKYFEPSEKEFMINYRVENVERLVEELRQNGVTILDSIEVYDYGKFVHILDPENNKIELWEPVDNEFTQSYEGETTK